jgi:hypothetical protein
MGLARLAGLGLARGFTRPRHFDRRHYRGDTSYHRQHLANPYAWFIAVHLEGSEAAS